MKVLSVSDVELSFLYSPHVTQRLEDIDLIISCGDLPYYYLEYLQSVLDVPLYYVRGNHASRVEHTSGGHERTAPWGGYDLHGRTRADHSGVLLAGVEGCLQYNYGPYQYSQIGMWMFVFRLVPGMLLNKLRFGRYLDIFVTHASPWKIHDMDDRPHRGARAFNWLIRVFQPLYHLHGHIHVYRPDTVTETQVGRTWVVNTYGYREVEVNAPYLVSKMPEKRFGIH